MNDVEVSIVEDTATADIDALKRALIKARVQRAVGTACTLLTKNHLNDLPENKNGWPTTGFYKAAARGTAWDKTNEGVLISIDTPGKDGAMKQRYHGGTIHMKDKMLTIPARQEFYGHRAGEFVNLRLVVFGHTGTAALVIGTGGAARVNFETGTENNKGMGKKSAGMVAYWLRESVDQKPNPGVIPTKQEYIETAKQAVVELVRDRRNNSSQN